VLPQVSSPDGLPSRHGRAAQACGAWRTRPATPKYRCTFSTASLDGHILHILVLLCILQADEQCRSECVLGACLARSHAPRPQVMSAASDLFFGDIEQHEPETMSFRDFLSLADGGESDDAAGDRAAAGPAAASCLEPDGHRRRANAAGHAAEQPGGGQSGRRYYLAQAGIGSQRQGSGEDGGGRCCAADADGQPAADSSSLAALASDFAPPPLLHELDGGQLQTNLWMSIR